MFVSACSRRKTAVLYLPVRSPPTVEYRADKNGWNWRSAAAPVNDAQNDEGDDPSAMSLDVAAAADESSGGRALHYFAF